MTDRFSLRQYRFSYYISHGYDPGKFCILKYRHVTDISGGHKLHTIFNGIRWHYKWKIT